MAADAQQWRVVGGAIMVRDGQDLKSEQKKNRLADGSIICQEKLVGQRLQYKLVSGTGPDSGWVSLKLKDQLLVERYDNPGAWNRWKPMAEDKWNAWPKYDMSMKPKTPKQFKEVMNEIVEGDFYGIKFPFTGEMMKEWGPQWLTTAMHTAGTLPADNEILEFTSFRVVGENVGTSTSDKDDNDWGGAGPKALLTVKFKNGPGNLTEGMFVKFAHVFEPGNERLKLSVNTPCPSGWIEIMFYNTVSGRVPVATPKGFFGDMARKTTNYILVTEMVAYGNKKDSEFGPGQILPPPPKYRDWSIPNVADYYYAHARSMARFFAWSQEMTKSTSQLQEMFVDPYIRGIIDALKEEIGPMKWSDRDKNFLEIIAQPHHDGIAKMLTFNESVAMGFLETAQQFIAETPHIFPQELVQPAFLQNFFMQAGHMAKHCVQMNWYQYMMPEYMALTHMNPQVDNAYYWRNDKNKMECGLLDWDGVNFDSMSKSLGNAWIGAEADTMAAHEEKLVQCFVDEYAVASGGVKLDFKTFHMSVKLAQAAVMFGCMANLGQLRRNVKPETWLEVKSRKDPQVDDQFLTRCYMVQVELFLAMWVKRSPYTHWKEWMKRTGQKVPRLIA